MTSTTRTISSVAVLGAGTMGAGIAAACASAGHRVLLLDQTAALADKAVSAMLEGRSPAVEDATKIALIETGSLTDDLARIADYDWVCEAIIEDLDTKRSLFEQLQPLRSPTSVVSTNTSGIPLRAIADGMPPELRGDLAVTHFFNPVKVMKLFELVPGEDTDPAVIDAFAAFGRDVLGKGVVHAKDTVNFIGNRIGCFFMLSGLHKAKPFLADGMSMETIDAALGAPVGLPPTGLYGLIDLIGLDVMELVGRNLAENLPADDAGRAFSSFPAREQEMHDRGQLGRKTGGGFSRVTRHDDGTRSTEIFDLIDGDWRPATEPDLEGVPADLGQIMFADSPAGELTWQIMGGTLRYAADLIPEIADDIVNIDRAITWGFNWVKGPFALLDEIGPRRVIERIRAEGGELPAMLAVLDTSGSDSFYRNDGTEFLGAEGGWHPVL